MQANREFQIATIKNILKKNGLDPDLIDVRSYIDETLSLEENARIIKEDYALISKRDAPQDTKSLRKIDRFLEAIGIFAKRKARQQRMDVSKPARETFERSNLSEENFLKWKANTNRYDITGVDTPY